MTPLVDVLLRELEHDRTFGVNPGASRLWPFAPPRLRLDFGDGRIDAETFWLQLTRWLEFRREQAA